MLENHTGWEPALLFSKFPCSYTLCCYACISTFNVLNNQWLFPLCRILCYQVFIHFFSWLYLLYWLSSLRYYSELVLPLHVIQIPGYNAISLHWSIKFLDYLFIYLIGKFLSHWDLFLDTPDHVPLNNQSSEHVSTELQVFLARGLQLEKTSKATNIQYIEVIFLVSDAFL